jgi:amino acid permease
MPTEETCLLDNDSHKYKETSIFGDDFSGICSNYSIYGIIPTELITGKSMPENGYFFVFILMLSSMIGSGILSQPYCFMQSGIILTIVINFLIGLLCLLSIYLILVSAERRNIFSYVDLSKDTLGSVGKKFTEVNIILFQFFATVSYIITVGFLTSQILSTIVNTDSSFGSFISRPSFDAVCIISGKQ